MRNVEESRIKVMDLSPQYLPVLTDDIVIPWRKLKDDMRIVDLTLAVYIDRHVRSMADLKVMRDKGYLNREEFDLAVKAHNTLVGVRSFNTAELSGGFATRVMLNVGITGTLPGN